MLNLKKIISITMIGTIALSITACSGSDNKNNDKEKATTPDVQGASWWTRACFKKEKVLDFFKNRFIPKRKSNKYCCISGIFNAKNKALILFLF